MTYTVKTGYDTKLVQTRSKRHGAPQRQPSRAVTVSSPIGTRPRRRCVPQRQPLQAGDGQRGVSESDERRHGPPQRQPLQAGDGQRGVSESDERRHGAPQRHPSLRQATKTNPKLDTTASTKPSRRRPKHHGGNLNATDDLSVTERQGLSTTTNPSNPSGHAPPSCSQARSPHGLPPSPRGRLHSGANRDAAAALARLTRPHTTRDNVPVVTARSPAAPVWARACRQRNPATGSAGSCQLPRGC